MTVKENLKRFFEEKKLDNKLYKIEYEGITHFIESDFIVNLILNATSPQEQKEVRNIITMIDFKNGDIHDFLKHLAKGYIVNNYSKTHSRAI